MSIQWAELPSALQSANLQAMQQIVPQLAEIEEIKEQNQLKLLSAFMQCRVASNHLLGSTGYGYDDAGRDKLAEVFACYTGSEAAIFRHSFASGTHALSTALFGILRPNQQMLCATGRPYDTLIGVIGLNGKGGGSLAEFGIGYQELALCAGGTPDLKGIAAHAKNSAMLYLQRSCGYDSRPALSLSDIAKAAQAAKTANPNIYVVVDNCYGEFVATEEPTHHGADLIVGSLIKNPGGGIAPSGGYIAGKAALVELCAQRMTAPGVGAEVGSSAGDVLRQLWLGLYFAPGVVAEAMKAGAYATALFSILGYEVKPSAGAPRGDIITAIHLKNASNLSTFCNQIQAHSPIDSHLSLQPWPMPGYNCDVIMAAGAFTLGSSIELSCDAPMRPPYTAFLQGGLNFAASRAAILQAAATLQP